MPVRKYTTKPRRKKENKEPASTPKPVNGRTNTSRTVTTDTTQTRISTNGSVVVKQPETQIHHNHHLILNGGTGSKTSVKASSSSSSSSSTSSNNPPKKSHKSHHARSIKELSSALNLSTSFSSGATPNGMSKCNSNRKITDYFQIRKSSRKCKSDLDKERHDHIEQAIKSGRDDLDGLEIRVLADKGRAVFANRAFRRGDFVCEYAGEMIPYALAKKREEMYAQDPNIGCYMYFFEYKSKQLCIDATSETDRLGRLLNHSKLDGNCQAKLFETATRPYIILVAARDIESGEELTYDYGERNKSAIEAHPWLAS